MKDIYRIIKGPLITEKSTQQKELKNRYSFVVAREANKCEIKEAVEWIFKVKVEEVHTQNMLGKIKRVRQHLTRRPHWKKALVTLKEGSIEMFEGA